MARPILADLQKKIEGLQKQVMSLTGELANAGEKLCIAERKQKRQEEETRRLTSEVTKRRNEIKQMREAMYGAILLLSGRKPNRTDIEALNIPALVFLLSRTAFDADRIIGDSETAYERSKSEADELNSRMQGLEKKLKEEELERVRQQARAETLEKLFKDYIPTT